MSIDTEFNVFAQDIFHSFIYAPDFAILENRKYGNVDFDKADLRRLYIAIQFRRTFLLSVRSQLEKRYKHFTSSAMEFYWCFQDNVAEVMPSQGVLTFDQLIISGALLMEMLNICHLRKNQDYLCCAPHCLAMYFDIRLKEKFYLDGGWKMLKLYTGSLMNAGVMMNILKCVVEILPGTKEDDLTIVKILFREVMKEYNCILLFNYFKSICDERQNVDLFCPCCELLYVTLKNFFIPSRNAIERNMQIEGYVKIFSRMLSDGDLKRIRGEMQRKFEEKSSAGENISKRSGTTEEQIKELHEKCRNEATMLLIERIFVGYYSSDSCRTSCIFCTTNFKRDTLSVKKELLHDDIEYIKFAVHETCSNHRAHLFQKNNDSSTGKLDTYPNNANIIEKRLLIKEKSERRLKHANSGFAKINKKP